MGHLAKPAVVTGGKLQRAPTAQERSMDNNVKDLKGNYTQERVTIGHLAMKTN